MRFTTYERRKGIFLTKNNLGTPHPFRLKSGHNPEISHANQVLSSSFQSAF